MTEFENTLSNICATIIVCLIFIALILYGIYWCIYTIKTDKMRQEYIKTLNEHDKAITMDYKNCYWTLKKGNRKDANNDKRSRN